MLYSIFFIIALSISTTQTRIQTDPCNHAFHNNFSIETHTSLFRLKSFENTLKNICQPFTDFQFILLCFSFRFLDPQIREGYIFHINLRHEHNHRLFCADALRKRDVSSATTETLRILFQSGHSPSSVLDTLKYDLQEQKGDNYIYAAADHSPFVQIFSTF